MTTRSFRGSLLNTGFTLCIALGGTTARAADDPALSVGSLAALVRAQAKLMKAQAVQIHDLQRRLDAVEKHTRLVSIPARPAPRVVSIVPGGKITAPPAGDAPRPTNAELAAAGIRNGIGAGEVAGPTTRLSSTAASSGPGFALRTRYPAWASAPGTNGAVSSLPQGEAPTMGATESIPARAQTQLGDGLVLDWRTALPGFSTPDGKYYFRVRGQMLADYGAAFGSRFHDQNVSRTAVRAIGIGVEGHAYNLAWYFEGDIIPNELQLVTAYVTWSDKTAGLASEYSLGSKWNERGFDGSTGSTNTVFLENNFIGIGLVPVKGYYGLGGTYKIYGRNWHFTTQITGEDVSYNSATSNTALNLRDNMTYEWRGHYIPYRTKDSLVHLGLWGFYEDVKPTTAFTQGVRLVARTDDAFEARISTLPLANSLAGGAELFGIYKSGWAQAEYGARRMKFRDTYAGKLSTGAVGYEQSASIASGIFLTGETPPYFARNGYWSAPRVLNPMLNGGPGAWELAARLDWFDASDVPSGGTAWSATFGINWYLADYYRLMFNFIHSNVNNRTGPYLGQTGGNLIGVRSSITF